MKRASIASMFNPLIICILIITASAPPIKAAEKIVLIGSHDTKASFHGRWLSLIYTEVFQRLGYEFHYEATASDLSTRISDAGKVDGEINRVSMYQASHPDMIRVDESHFSTTLGAYAVKPGLALDGWDSLKNSDYLLEYRRGTKIVQAGLTIVGKIENVSTVTLTAQGLKRLLLGRTDIYIDVATIVEDHLRQLDPTQFDPSRVYQAGIMARDTLHAYMHKKNAGLVPKISATLKTMKKEGVIEQYRQRISKEPIQGPLFN